MLTRYAIFYLLLIIVSSLMPVNGRGQAATLPVTGFTVNAGTGARVSRVNNTPVITFYKAWPGSKIDLVANGHVWDLSHYRFLRCEVINEGASPQIIELGINGIFWTLGAAHTRPHERQTIKALLLKDEQDTLMDRRYPGMNGHPDGFTKLWFNTRLDTVSKITLVFPRVKPGMKLRIVRVWAEEPYITENAIAELPFVDNFGQFKHLEWPEKVHTSAELAKTIQERPADGAVKGWDKWGGYLNGPALRATGHFRVQKYRGKWWLVDPDGRLFWSSGIDCVNAEGMTCIKGRENYFDDLPKEKTYLPFYNREKTAVNFRAANLYRKLGPEWETAFAAQAHRRLKSWGINTIGNWSDPLVYRARKTAYVLTVSGKRFGQLVDPFQTGFQQDMENQIRELAGSAPFADQWCLGFFADNELKWRNITYDIATAPANQPAKIAFKSFLQSKYGPIRQLNNAWRTTYTTWNDLLNMHIDLTVPSARADVNSFARVFACRYFEKCNAAVRTAAPGFMYLGCRFDFHSYPADTALHWVIAAAAKYCDVVSFNRYTYTCAELKPLSGENFPILIGEFHFGSLDRGMLHPGLKYVADQTERSAFYESFMTEAITNPFIVGAHWFQYADQPLTGRNDGENYQVGFVTVADVPYRQLVKKARRIAFRLYLLRLQVKRP